MLPLTDIRSRTQGRVEGEDHNLWGSRANGAEGKAHQVHSGGQFLAKPEAVTEDVFFPTVRYREKDPSQVGVVHATPDRPEREVTDGLRHVVQRHLGPLVLMGDFNK